MPHKMDNSGLATDSFAPVHISISLSGTAFILDIVS
jgi:hypothetical protein